MINLTTTNSVEYATITSNGVTIKLVIARAEDSTPEQASEFLKRFETGLKVTFGEQLTVIAK